MIKSFNIHQNFHLDYLYILERLYAYVDKRMTVKELKNQLVPYINIPSDFIILNRYKSNVKLEELALPSSSLEDLNYMDSIHITMGQALRDGEYRGVIFWPEPQDQTQVIVYLKVCLNIILSFFFIYRLS